MSVLILPAACCCGVLHPGCSQPVIDACAPQLRVRIAGFVGWWSGNPSILQINELVVVLDKLPTCGGAPPVNHFWCLPLGGFDPNSYEVCDVAEFFPNFEEPYECPPGTDPDIPNVADLTVTIGCGSGTGGDVVIPGPAWTVLLGGFATAYFWYRDDGACPDQATQPYIFAGCNVCNSGGGAGLPGGAIQEGVVEVLGVGPPAPPRRRIPDIVIPPDFRPIPQP